MLDENQTYRHGMQRGRFRDPMRNRVKSEAQPDVEIRNEFVTMDSRPDLDVVVQDGRRTAGDPRRT
jgi:hypothetical protein